MKIPATPPNHNSLLDGMIKEPGRLVKLLSLGIKADPKGKYYHWDKLKKSYILHPLHRLYRYRIAEYSWE